MTWISWLIIGTTLGVQIGIFLSDRKWRNNANRIQRIECGGKLYKVLHDKDYDRIEDNYP